MSKSFLASLKANGHLTTTENGAGAYDSTLNACLDAFGSLGAMRKEDAEVIVHTFSRAFAENRETAMRLLFYMRDIRGGQGARRVSRLIYHWLATNYPTYIIRNLDNILYFGRGDDYLDLLDTPIYRDVIAFIGKTLKEDIIHCTNNESCSLLAKWLPSENASSASTVRYARMICKGLKLSPRNYRRMLTKLRRYLEVVECKMSANQWTDIKYAALPAKAALNYSDAFVRHDNDGYYNYLKDVAEGKAKVNAASLYPVDIIHEALNNYRPTQKDRVLYDASWKALPNYLEGKDETGICVVDVSGSMSGLPMEVAISLGMYCADKCRGPFMNHFITFSGRPELVEITGGDIFDKARNISRANWDGSTNLEAVFDLMLTTAIHNQTAPADMPNKLYIISDMQFNEAEPAYEYHYSGYGWGRRYEKIAKKPFMESMRAKYERAGYTLPTIVYWNVRSSRCGMFQQTYQGAQCAMVSGYSASLFKAVVDGTTYEEEFNERGEKTVKEVVDPINVMRAALFNERYDRVWVG